MIVTAVTSELLRPDVHEVKIRLTFKSHVQRGAWFIYMYIQFITYVINVL